MFSIRKSFNFYTLTILLGNLFVWVMTAFIDSPISFLQPQADHIFFFFGITYVFSFPIAILSLLFFSIQQTAWPKFGSSASSAITMSLIVSVAWATFLSYTIFEHQNEYLICLPFVLSAPIAALLGELWYDHKHAQNGRQL